MKWIYFIFLLYYPLTLTAEGNIYNMQDIQKINRFKDKVNFDKAISLENTQEIVKVNWYELLHSSWLIKDNYLITAESISVFNGSASQVWILSQNSKIIKIEIFASSQGFKKAQDAFIFSTTMNSMIDAPYILSPVKVGSLSVINQTNPVTDIMCLFRNIFFSISSKDEIVNVIEIAKWLQSSIQQKVVKINDYSIELPAKLQVSSLKIKVGEIANIQAQFDKFIDKSRYMIDFDIDYDTTMLEVISRDTHKIKIRANTIGKTALGFYLVDKKTLLLKYKLIQFEFIPKTP